MICPVFSIILNILTGYLLIIISIINSVEISCILIKWIVGRIVILYATEIINNNKNIINNQV